MHSTVKEILLILDRCALKFTFPMLDNGYLYLAATRLSLYRSEDDWGMVIEVFGYSPRAGLPDTHLHTFASTLRDRDSPKKYKTRQAYENYLRHNPHNESRFIYPIGERDWAEADYSEHIADHATMVEVRGRPVMLPVLEEYGRYGIELEEAPRIRVFDLCRLLAAVEREQVLANPRERRISIPAELQQVMQLEEWNHPDVVQGELPSQSEAFQRLAHVLMTGDPLGYQPSKSSNTRWRNWPEGGLL